MHNKLKLCLLFNFALKVVDKLRINSLENSYNYGPYCESKDEDQDRVFKLLEESLASVSAYYHRADSPNYQGIANKVPYPASFKAIENNYYGGHGAQHLDENHEMPVIYIILDWDGLFEVKKPYRLSEDQIRVAAKHHIRHLVPVSLAVFGVNGQGVADNRRSHVNYVDRCLLLCFWLEKSAQLKKYVRGVDSVAPDISVLESSLPVGLLRVFEVLILVLVRTIFLWQLLFSLFARLKSQDMIKMAKLIACQFLQSLFRA